MFVETKKGRVHANVEMTRLGHCNFNTGRYTELFWKAGKDELERQLEPKFGPKGWEKGAE